MATSKERILFDNEFKYDFTRMIYFNKETKKIFSFEAIDDNDESWLQEKVTERNQDWKFYFNDPQPPQKLQEEIINELKR